MPLGRLAIQGKPALRHIWANDLQREVFVATYFPSIHLSDADDMAYDIGRHQIPMTKEGQHEAFDGKYVELWKFIDPTWTVFVDIDNDNGNKAHPV